MSQHEEVSPPGYDREELYFFEQNKKLFEARRKRLNAERLQRAHADNQAAHWMKCPKCGEDMQEADMSGIKVDRCTSCLGTYFDAGELDLLLECKEHVGLWGRLYQIFHSSGAHGDKSRTRANTRV
ncbi:MAG: zf-TFIIB domain-containing protein [Verrucomicrobia bacterium]|nr:zf-TFIIB domain-containing protein [Verrucomicrobiota bacterium]